MKLKLHWQILIAMAVAAVFSLALGEHSRFVEPLGTLFINLLKMVIIPLVFLSIVTGIAGMGDPKKLGRLGWKTVTYYLATSFIAILLGFTLVNMIQPGQSAQVEGAEAFHPETLPAGGSLSDVLVRMVPDNPVKAAVEGDILGLIVFSIVFGLGLLLIPNENSDRALSLLQTMLEAVMKIVHGIVRLAPIGVFGLMVALFNQNLGTGMFQAVGWYMATIALGLSLHLFVILPLIFYAFTRRNPVTQFQHMAPALATVFATSSSMATLPVTMECVEDNAGVSNTVAGFVLPLGATANMDGTALLECVGVVFITQVLGIPLTFDQQVILILTALLASIGAAAVPSAGLVMMFIILDAVGIKGEQAGLIVGTMLAVDRPLDMFRGLVNIFSDSVGAVIIAQSEGEDLKGVGI